MSEHQTLPTQLNSKRFLHSKILIHARSSQWSKTRNCFLQQKTFCMTADKVCNVSNAFFQFLSTSKLIFCIAVSSTLVVFKKAAFPSTKLEEKSSRINKTKIHNIWKSPKSVAFKNHKKFRFWKSPKMSYLSFWI